MASLYRPSAAAALKCCRSAQAQSPAFATRTISTSLRAAAEWQGKSKEDIAVKRKDTDPHDIQASASKRAHEESESGATTSQAISRKDEAGSKAKAEQEHPSAPKPVIGMNDERGKKGH